MNNQFHATTVIAIRHEGSGAIAGDGQVTFGENMIMKAHAKKVRRLYQGKVIAGFAGSVADAITLFEKFEGKIGRASCRERVERTEASRALKRIHEENRAAQHGRGRTT